MSGMAAIVDPIWIGGTCSTATSAMPVAGS